MRNLLSFSLPNDLMIITLMVITYCRYEFFKYILARKHDDICFNAESDKSINTSMQQLPISRTNNPTSFSGTGLFHSKSSGPVLLDVTRS